MTVPTTIPGHRVRTTSRLRELDGLRGVAAMGVVVTHVAFQTGVDPSTPWGAVFARFDFFVAVFFALSAFVLWRGYGPPANAPRANGPLANGPLANGTSSQREFSVGRYTRSRIARIVPAYVVCVVAVIVLVPELRNISGSQILANLTLTQLYHPAGLVSGLTHLWSLGVEVAFYVVFPFLVLLLASRRPMTRILTFSLVAVLSLGWAFVPWVASGAAADVPNRQIYPPAYMLWFAVGLIAAEFEGRVGPRMKKLLGVRWLWWLVALVTAWVAGQEWFSPLGLQHPEPHEFVRRVLAGAVFAAAIVVPHALAPRENSWLTTPVMQYIGYISYSLFLWHMGLMALLFPLVDQPYFAGGFVPMLVLTLAASLVVAAASYEWIEKPGNRLVKGLKLRLEFDDR